MRAGVGLPRLLAGGDGVTVEDGGDLSGDFPGGEVAADAELGGEAELAVDGAADLAGDADGGALVDGRCLLGGGFGLRWLGSVTIGHPDGFDGLAVGHLDEVALGAIDGFCGLDDLGQADGMLG